MDDLKEARLQDLLWEKARPNCVSHHSLDARFGCDESSQVCRSSDVSRFFEPSSRLTCTEGCLCHAVLCETWEEPFERPLPDLVVDLCSTLFLQDCVAVNPQDVVDTADFQALSEGELRLRVLAELDAFVCWSDAEVSRPNSHSECDATVGNCRSVGHFPHVTNSPLGWRCIQIIRFQWVPLRSDSGVGNVEVLQKR